MKLKKPCNLIDFPLELLIGIHGYSSLIGIWLQFSVLFNEIFAISINL